jgi:transcriptional regulator with XRE-family HTH domain
MARTTLTLPFSGRKLRELRERHGWLQSDLEARCEQKGRRVARDRISRFETGRARPSAPALVTMAAALGVEVDDLLDTKRAA